MELTVLGSGTAVPHPRRSSAGFWVRARSGSLLLDCSASAIHRMAQEELPWAGLDAIWISHFHLDHCAGLAPLLFATRRAPQTRDREEPLTIFGPSGLQGVVETFDSAANHRLLDQPFEVRIIEVEPLEPFEILPGVEAVAHKTPHTDESNAIHLRDGETTFVYTADTGFDEPLAAFARRVDLLLMECSFVKDKTVEKHLELAEAMHIVRKAEPKKTILTHFYAEWDDVDFDLEVAKHSPQCEVIEAVDGLKVEF